MSISHNNIHAVGVPGSGLSQLLVKLALITMTSMCVFGQVYAGNDLDGVPDAVDLDDDNDGILDSVENICTPPSTTLNSSGYALNTQLQTTPGFPLSFFGGGLEFSAVLNGTAGWVGGVQVQNDAVEGDYLFVQPNNSAFYFTSGNSVTYTLNFPFGPIRDLVMNPGGLNFDDGTTITAFNGATALPIGAGNFTIPVTSTGMSVQTNNATDDTVASTNTTGGIDVLGNDYTLTIPGPVTRVVIETGKTDAATGNVTLGFSGISWDCIGLDTDLDGTPDYLDTDADGDMCNDADEAYAAVGTDTNGDGTFGGVIGPGQVDGVGQVTGAGYPAPATTGGQTTFQEGITLSVDADPTQQAFIVGNTADFSATVSSMVVVNDPVVTTGSDVIYQWQVSTDGGTTFNNVAGGVNGSGTTTSGSIITYTTPTLTIPDASNQYRVVVTSLANICGSNSAAADFNAPFADLTVTKTDTIPANTEYTPGEAFEYTITIINGGPDAADGSVVADSLPAWAIGATWTCTASGGAVCPNPNGSGSINETIATFPNAGQLSYVVSGTYSTDMTDYP